jgi:hypothetical protein
VFPKIGADAWLAQVATDVAVVSNHQRADVGMEFDVFDWASDLANLACAGDGHDPLSFWYAALIV